MLFVQALGIFPDSIEALALRRVRAPRSASRRGSPRLSSTEAWPLPTVVAIPNGIDHRTFRVTRPSILERDARVAMNFNPHPLKHVDAGIDALRRLHREQNVAVDPLRHPSAGRTVRDPGIRFADSPDHAVVAEKIYNNSTMYLQPSRHRGIRNVRASRRWPAVARSSRLRTAARHDYALDGETALVCGPDVEQLAEAIARLVTDDDLRVRIAENGRRSVERFRWEASAERLARVAVDALKSVTRANSESP